MPHKKNTIDDFWKHVVPGDLNECWIWKGAPVGYGYGMMRIGNRRFVAHRLSYQIHYGKITPGMLILHSCDNPLCVNPNHLREGTPRDNVKDMWERNRASYNLPKDPLKGEDHGMAKLNWEQVHEIRRRYIPYKVTSIELGLEYGVSHTMISCIVNGKNWKAAYPEQASHRVCEVEA